MRCSIKATVAATIISLMIGGISHAQILKIEEPLLAPIGQTIFCLANPNECRRYPVTLEFLRRSRHELYSELNRINRQVNAAIRPEATSRTEETFGTWELMPRTGDCNDFAVSKRHALLDQGWPSSSLLLAIAQLANGQHHLVLLAVLPDEVIVLDNLRDETLPFRSVLNYQWKKVSSPADVTSWLALL